ncbi:MAG: Ig-like domain repeat protein [Candidatus Bathyarchaeia archaeon]
MKNVSAILMMLLLVATCLSSVSIAYAAPQESATTFNTPLAYQNTGYLSYHELHYWRVSANAGDTLTIGIDANAGALGGWTSQLYYSNLTLIQSITDYNAHNHLFSVPKNDNYILVLASLANAFNYTINSSHPMLFAAPNTVSKSFMPNEIQYWRVTANAGDVLLIGVDAVAGALGGWTSELYYSNLTLAQSITTYNAHNHMFVVPKTDSYIFVLASLANAFNYTIVSSRPMLFAVPYEGDRSLSYNELDYWWFNANAGDVLLIGLDADAGALGGWTSTLYYANLTQIQSIGTYNAHNHMFIVPKTGNYLLMLSSLANSFNYTIVSSNPMLLATPYRETGDLSTNEVDYWWFNNVKQGDVLLIGVDAVAGALGGWRSELYFSNTTLVQSITTYNAHSHMLVAPKADNYLLVLSSLANSFNYTIVHNNGVNLLPTSVQFSLQPNPAAPGDMVTLLGNLTSNGSPISSAQVTLKVNGGTVAYLTTNSTGWFKASAQAPSPGVYNVTARYEGSGQYAPSESSVMLVIKEATKIYCRIDPNPVNAGSNFTYEGILVNGFSQPLAGASVQLYNRTLSGSWVYFATVTTNSYGIFRFEEKAAVAGTFVFAAYYAGSTTRQSSYNYAIQVVQ